MTDDFKKDLSDAELEKLFQDSKPENDSLMPERKQALTRKIVSKAKTENSAKTLSEYSFIKFWSVFLEFITVFCTLLDPKKVNKNSEDKEQKK